MNNLVGTFPTAFSIRLSYMHLDDLCVDGRMLLKRIFKKWDGGSMDSTAVAQDRDRWLTLVNAVMKLWVPSNVGNVLTGRKESAP